MMPSDLRAVLTRLFTATALMPALAVSAAAQAPATVTPEEFYGFALSYRALTSEIAKRRATNADSAEGLESAAIAHYRISREQFRRVAGVIGPMFARLEALDKEARAYIGKAGTRPDVSVLGPLYARRVAILTDGRDNVKKTLPPGAWLSLSSYIKEHVSTIRWR